MVGLDFVLFVPTSIENDGGSYTIAVIRESNYETSLMISCLAFICFLIEVMVMFHYYLLFIRRRYLIVSLDIINGYSLVSFILYFNL